MSAPPSPHLLRGTTALRFPDAVACVRAALQQEGLSILSEIDMRETMRTRLGEEIEPQVIFGACDPRHAHRAMQVEPALGALLPCGVVVRRQDGATHVDAVDPDAMLALAGNPAVAPLAYEIRSKLQRALSNVWRAT